MGKPLSWIYTGVPGFNALRARTVYVHLSFSGTGMKKTRESQPGNDASGILLQAPGRRNGERRVFPTVRRAS
jgi:hypothetical protein